MELMKASNQWMSRPQDERFLTLIEMQHKLDARRHRSVGKVLPNRELELRPIADQTNGVALVGPQGVPALPSHWAFGQLAQRAGAPAGYLRELPAPLASDCVNYGLRYSRDVEELGLLIRKDEDGTIMLDAATGPNYGRIWNSEIVHALVNRFGDGVTGDFRVPGEFGKSVEIGRHNTTLFAGDRDMFVFLADEEHRIEIADRRDGKSGSLARGFFVWNSEVGSSTFGIATFLFDYVCCNRIVWGAREYKEIKLRHTSGAPSRFIEEVAPALTAYAQSSTRSVVQAIEDARGKRIDDVSAFLMQRFTKGQAQAIQLAHSAEEGRPIETLWDAATGVTAYAKRIEWQDERVSFEREAGKILELAA